MQLTWTVEDVAYVVHSYHLMKEEEVRSVSSSEGFVSLPSVVLGGAAPQVRGDG